MLSFFRLPLLIGVSFACALHPVETTLHEKTNVRTDLPTSTFIAERDELCMLATLAYAFKNTQDSPRPGYEIASMIAWNVEDGEHIPEFVMDRNRNFEMQGEVFHAEINTLRKAILKKYNFSKSALGGLRDFYLDYTYRMSHTTLYTSLEPCPMCAMTLLLARVPRVIYFMEDPGMRDPETHKMNISLPSEVYGRKISISPSSIPLALTALKAMREDVSSTPPPPYVEQLSNGHKDINIIKYISAKAQNLFRSAYEELAHYVVQHEENRKLLENLQKSVGIGVPSSGEGLSLDE